jgi:hypothetical protein
MLNFNLFQNTSNSRLNNAFGNGKNSLINNFQSPSKLKTPVVPQFSGSIKNNIFNNSFPTIKPMPYQPPSRYAPVYPPKTSKNAFPVLTPNSAHDQTLTQNCPPNSIPTPTPVPTPSPVDCPPTPTPIPTPSPVDCPPTPTPVPTPAPVPTPPPYNGGTDCGFEGDPHLTGFDGEKYDVMGQAGKTYNMISDKGFQYNTQFETLWGDNNNAVGAAGIQVGSSQVSLDAKTKQATVNNAAMTLNQKVSLDKGGSAFWDGTNLTVNSKEYNVNLKVSTDIAGTNYLDSSVKLASDPFADGVKPQGLVGQTADGIAGQKNTGIDQGNQGGTVIDGKVQDYEVSGLFDTSFSKNNRFNG